jgi:hypothetical protein
VTSLKKGGYMAGGIVAEAANGQTIDGSTIVAIIEGQPFGIVPAELKKYDSMDPGMRMAEPGETPSVVLTPSILIFSDGATAIL